MDAHFSKRVLMLQNRPDPLDLVGLDEHVGAQPGDRRALGFVLLDREGSDEIDEVLLHRLGHPPARSPARQEFAHGPAGPTHIRRSKKAGPGNTHWSPPHAIWMESSAGCSTN